MNHAFEICDKSFVAIMRRTNGKLVLDRLSPTEETVALVYEVIGLVGNGGIKGLLSDEFDGDPGYRRTIHAFQEIGCVAAASLLEQAIYLWNSLDHSQLEDPEYMLMDDYLDEEHPEISRQLSELEEKFEDQQSDIIDRLSKFIRTNKLDK